MPCPMPMQSSGSTSWRNSNLSNIGARSMNSNRRPRVRISTAGSSTMQQQRYQLTYHNSLAREPHLVLHAPCLGRLCLINIVRSPGSTPAITAAGIRA
ncbi:hypothetical protein BD626DRAFT_506084 [Schizophyllum amplum]|uniref:Uncharacterized protein n=1 Tax=Schizophyllum amplum TaxID=97359 RepID=A0A550C5B5_9AGAR|nr:hypothetical protein BD626DRAFT_506084 [Auriculariopsis ampla]